MTSTLPGTDITNSENGALLHICREDEALSIELLLDGTNDYASVGTPSAKLTQLPPSWAAFVLMAMPLAAVADLVCN